MEIMHAISNRKSIRKFSSRDISKNIIENILEAGIKAPSPKNIQPWKFIVLSGNSKNELIKVIEKGMENVKSSFGLLLKEINFLASAEASIKIMEEAPVIIIVINTENKCNDKKTPVKKFLEMANVQSAGAAIENMLLAALEYGLGSLWISDIYYTIEEIGSWLKTDRQIIAAVALGYPAEDPAPSAKKELDAFVEWKGAWRK